MCWICLFCLNWSNLGQTGVAAGLSWVRTERRSFVCFRRGVNQKSSAQHCTNSWKKKKCHAGVGHMDRAEYRARASLTLNAVVRSSQLNLLLVCAASFVRLLQLQHVDVCVYSLLCCCVSGQHAWACVGSLVSVPARAFELSACWFVTEQETGLLWCKFSAELSRATWFLLQSRAWVCSALRFWIRVEEQKEHLYVQFWVVWHVILQL